jgi:hypothetical protein
MLFVKDYLLEEVSARLGKVFNNMGYTINVDETYLTSIVINEKGEQLVDYSESLSWAIMSKVQENELADFSDEFVGVFSERWTFDPVYRIVELDMIDINTAGSVVVESYRNK